MRSAFRITKRIALRVSETLQILLSTTPALGPARVELGLVDVARLAAFGREQPDATGLVDAVRQRLQ